jgi:hypothetical protein
MTLHVADCIETMGPPGCYWAFPMERWCGYCLRAIKSRRYPWANIKNYVVASTRLHTIKLMYALSDRLLYSTGSLIGKRERVYEGCKLIVWNRI